MKGNRKQFFVKRLHERAILPKMGSTLAAGYDLYSVESKSVPSRGKAIVKTGIAIQIPHGNYARIAPRSGLAAKHMIDVGAGVIDEDYRGEIGIVLFNHGPDAFQVNEGDRIAQLIITKITYTDIVEVKELTDSMRGEKGWGSTGTGVMMRKPQKIKKTDLKGMLEKENTTDLDYQEFCVLGLYLIEQQKVISMEEKQRIGKKCLEEITFAKRLFKILQEFQDTGNKEKLLGQLKE